MEGKFHAQQHGGVIGCVGVMTVARMYIPMYQAGLAKSYPTSYPTWATWTCKVCTNTRCPIVSVWGLLRSKGINVPLLTEVQYAKFLNTWPMLAPRHHCTGNCTALGFQLSWILSRFMTLVCQEMRGILKSSILSDVRGPLQTDFQGKSNVP